MGVEIQMPQMGESVTEGTILEWHVSEGDSVQEGDTVVEVSTDKVDAEVPAPASGVISKILAQPDDTVQVGQALAELDTSGNGASGDGAAAQSSEPAAEASAEAAGNGSRAGADSSAKTATATTDDASVSAGATTDAGELEVVMPE